MKQTDIQRKILDWLDKCPVQHEISSMSGFTMHIKVSTSELSSTRNGPKKPPIVDEPMCIECHSADVYSLHEEDEPYLGHCNECDEDQTLTIYEGDNLK